eukprot:TRINITY_DN19926_c0_g1_i1.p1 TRINITY_DN19926_c0_g1~~TRINITY_DN19926_c0_g1_i1.p1  ORF type:complete len:270 (+),score=18.28 TRINITY_DN19926_c0_g1_i1:24-833(+)
MDGLDAYYYDMMNLPKIAGEADIHRVFLFMGLRWHPAKNPQRREEAESRFKNLCECYEVLSDFRMRSCYDRYGKKGLIWDFKYKPSPPVQVFDRFFRENGGADLVQQYLQSGSTSDFSPPPEWFTLIEKLQQVQAFDNLFQPTITVDPFDEDFPVTNTLQQQNSLTSPTATTHTSGSNHDKMISDALAASFERSLNLSDAMDTSTPPAGVSARQHMMNQWRESKSQGGSRGGSSTSGSSSGFSATSSPSTPGEYAPSPHRTPRSRRGFL